MQTTNHKHLAQHVLAALAILVCTTGYSQTLTQNYVRTRMPRTKISSNATLDTYTSNKDSVETAIQYIDGIGRPLQSIQVKGSPLGFDMIQPFAYDVYGRQSTNYLPYTPQTGTAGTYRSTALPTDQAAFYTTPPSGSGVTAITDPYAQVAYEISPLNRPVEQGAPGVPWQLTGVSGGGHTMKMAYTLNNSTSFTTDSLLGRQVARYNATVNSDQTRTIAANGNYSANTLTVTISKDENWASGRAGTVEEYKDKEGHVVLKRQYNYTTVVQCLSTYYVYDDMGLLAFVLPPLAGGDAATTPTSTTLNTLCYQYRYDERGRASQKKIPGKGWEYTVFNTIDQPVATQDSLQRFNKNWIVTKYDAIGRPALTHIWNNGGTAVSRSALQTTLTGLNTNLWEAPSASGTGYTNVAWPTTLITATLFSTYYDGYIGIPGLPATYTVASGISNMTRGIATVKKTAVLNTLTDQLWDVTYTDDLGRNIKSYAQHYLAATANTNNYDLLTTTYNFTNAPTTTLRKHFNTTSTTIPLLTVANTYYYDHMGRKRSTWEQITKKDSVATAKRLVSKIDYNEIAQVLNKHLHSTDSTTYLQNLAYTYNERGWLVTSSAPLFAMQLCYNIPNPNKLYNGNITYQYWGTPGNLNNNYTYLYDKLNRLLSGNNLSSNNENTILYDPMGNITALKRYQTGTLIDNLAYTYTGNQVGTVADASGSNTGLVNGTTNYTYDGNGNMITNTNTVNTGQNKTLTYNLLNLPQVVTVPTGTVTYTYDAAGTKLRKVSVLSGVTKTHDYISGIQYENSTSAIAFIQTEEGKAALAGAGANYTYYLGDNLGNTRVTFETRTGAAVQIQKDDYYPFGMEINSVLPTVKNEYLYNKKELQEETQEYDYGARFYDPVIARWNVIDPLAEVSRRWSPYNYGMNSPIRITDPDGMMTEAQNDQARAELQIEQLSGMQGSKSESNGQLPTNETKTDTTTKASGKGYVKTFTENISNYDLATNSSEILNSWLDDPTKLFSDALNSINNTIYSIGSLFDGRTYSNFYNNYLMAPPEQKAKLDADAFNSTLTGLVTAAPVASFSSSVGTSIRSTGLRTIDNGVIMRKPYFRVQVGNEPLAPIKGRGVAGARGVPHINIATSNFNLHILVNPLDWKGWGNKPFLPFRH